MNQNELSLHLSSQNSKEWNEPNELQFTIWFMSSMNQNLLFQNQKE